MLRDKRESARTHRPRRSPKRVYMICRRLFITLVVLTTLVSQALAQQNDPSILTLDRLFGSTEFAGQSLGPIRWLDDGSGYTRLEPSGTVKDGRDIVRYDAESGRRE